MNIVIIISIISIISITALVMACLAFSRTFKNNREGFSKKKGRKVLLDMGGHHGQSAIVAINNHIFDNIYIFEPVPANAKKIRSNIMKYKDDPVDINIITAGLGNGESNPVLYKPGSEGGTTYKNRFNKDIKKLTVKQLDAGEWFKKNITIDDKVYVKINCEGCEIGILDSLLNSNEIRKVNIVLVDFDCKRLFNRGDERDRIIRELNKKHVKFIDPRDIEKWCGGGACSSKVRMQKFCDIIKKDLNIK